MENYTKYALKSAQELTQVLSGRDRLFVIACNKCFKEFESIHEPDLDEFLTLAESLGKTVTGSMRLDFVCNKTQTAKALENRIPEGTENIVVISCGLGIQTVASLVKLPVIAACNSINYTGHHGMALTKKACDACAQCYLGITGGICPIVDCSKSLVNGQCGGAKDGKCEVDPNKDCAWQKIQERLEQQGRLEELTAQPVQIRDYSKVNFKKINDYVKAIRAQRFAGYYGGVHPLENKERTEHLPLVRFPDVDTVALNLAQHAGAPATCIVNVGDHVDVGQKVGEAAGFISANVHASVSGTVVAIENRIHAARGTPCLCVVIENDKKYTLHESVQPRGSLEELTPQQIVAIVKEAGIIGMGGAGFPMYVKLMPKTPIDTVLLNGCECEPLLTADHRVMLEQADEVIYGLQAILKAVNAPKGIIVLEDNKPDAAALLQEKTRGLENIEIFVAKTKYPQGAEKMLIKNVMGRQVPNGGLPADVGCVVANVSTAKAISDAIRLGLPVVERVCTVTGDRVPNPGNFLIRIGTNAKELLDYCGGVTGEGEYVAKMGGMMMGSIQENLDLPTTKCSGGITIYDADETEPNECIKCGRCVDVCPMELKPLYFAKQVMDAQALKDQGIMNCLECRCCEYICSSKIPLVSLIRIGKNAVRGMK